MATNPVGGGGAAPSTAAGTTQQTGRPDSPIPLQPMNTRRRAISAQNRVFNLRRAARAMSNRVRRAAAGGPASGRAPATAAAATTGAARTTSTGRPTATARPVGRSRTRRP